MAVRDIVPVPGASFEEALTAASPDLTVWCPLS
jgi:hypothetical protein